MPESPPSPVTGSSQVVDPLKASVPLSWVPPRASLQRILRVERDALELQRRQARVERLQPGRDAAQPGLAVREVDAGETAVVAALGDVLVLPAGPDQAAVVADEHDVRVLRRERQRVLVRVHVLEVRGHALGDVAAVTGHVGEACAGVGRQLDAATVRAVGAGVHGKLAVLHRAADDHAVGSAGGRGHEHVVPALTGADIERGEAGIGRVGRREVRPAAVRPARGQRRRGSPGVVDAEQRGAGDHVPARVEHLVVARVQVDPGAAAGQGRRGELVADAGGVGVRVEEDVLERRPVVARRNSP